MSVGNIGQKKEWLKNFVEKSENNECNKVFFFNNQKYCRKKGN